MTRIQWLAPALGLAVLVGCNKRAQNDNTTGSVADTAMAPSGGAGMTSDTGMAGRDTSMSGMSSDTSSGMSRSDSTGMRSSDTSGTSSKSGKKGNQTKSGVTDTKTGKSTLGPGVTKTRPDQGAPVTSKGDTIGTAGTDSMSDSTSR